jgi:hypothetical protein
MVAHVEGWTPEKDRDQTTFDLYPLDEATNRIVSLTVNGEKADQEWYVGFGPPTKEAMESAGELMVREGQ